MPTGVEIEYNQQGSADVASCLSRAKIIKRLEIETVRHGLRPASLLFNVPHFAAAELQQECNREGLAFAILDKLVIDEGFSHSARRATADEPYKCKCVVAATEDILRLVREADRSMDDFSCGNLLGYPECCAEFFADAWRAKAFDPIWQTAARGRADETECVVEFNNQNALVSRIISVRPDSDASLLLCSLRYIGIRIISHFPCHPTCEASIVIAKDRIALAKQLKLPGLEETLKLFRLPLEWKCHAGTATVTTPCFRFRVNSMHYDVSHVVRWNGYPPNDWTCPISAAS